jgi:hypothetical protein
MHFSLLNGVCSGPSPPIGNTICTADSFVSAISHEGSPKTSAKPQGVQWKEHALLLTTRKSSISLSGICGEVLEQE